MGVAVQRYGSGRKDWYLPEMTETRATPNITTSDSRVPQFPDPNNLLCDLILTCKKNAVRKINMRCAMNPTRDLPKPQGIEWKEGDSVLHVKSPSPPKSASPKKENERTSHPTCERTGERKTGSELAETLKDLENFMEKIVYRIYTGEITAR
ncbi:hypothetical protein GOBAR_AA29362 [Gossypium barbadense]|uniref:Uncharacterized protein n=1 Tax=Gossypium barbadense TaxID=3634 RepID=A0A2P5WJQ8_GOSBA|nr:hypothetical protein GOBAR_AA29362 [Gossypium barbadense]